MVRGTLRHIVTMIGLYNAGHGADIPIDRIRYDTVLEEFSFLLVICILPDGVKQLSKKGNYFVGWSKGPYLAR